MPSALITVAIVNNSYHLEAYKLSYKIKLKQNFAIDGQLEMI